jgi:hypothetical protein
MILSIQDGKKEQYLYMREALPEPLNAFGTLGKANLEAPQVRKWCFAG